MMNLKFDSVTAALLVGGLLIAISVLAILAFYLFRKNQSVMLKRVETAELNSHKADIRSSAGDERIRALEDRFDLALQIERLKGRTEAQEGLLRSFATTMISQTRSFALQETRAELQRVVRAEIEAEQASQRFAMMDQTFKRSTIASQNAEPAFADRLNQLTQPPKGSDHDG